MPCVLDAVRMGRARRTSLAIELTPHCNQKCSYCYNDWRGDAAKAPSLAGDELLRLVERAVTELDLEHVTLTGGEPFARAELFDVLAVLERHGLRAIIISNGGLISDAHAARLAPYRPHFVQVTLNGPDAALHEAHVGPGCFAPTLRGIEALTAHGVTVAGCVVVTRRNAASVGRILERFEALGVRQIALSRFSPAGYASEHTAALLPSRRDVLTALDLASAHAHRLSIQVTMPVPPCVVSHADYPSIRFSSCPIGTEAQEFVLGSRGELRHCTLHVDAVGDARSRSFSELVELPAVRGYRDVTPAFCAPCPMRSECVGGCGAAAFAVTGDARELDPFVGQHVDDALAARLAAARGGGAFVPIGRLSRSRRDVGAAGEAGAGATSAVVGAGTEGIA